MRKPSKETLKRHRQIVQADFTIYAVLLELSRDVIPQFSKLRVQHWIAQWDRLVKLLH